MPPPMTRRMRFWERGEFDGSALILLRVGATSSHSSEVSGKLAKCSPKLFERCPSAPAKAIGTVRSTPPSGSMMPAIASAMLV